MIGKHVRAMVVVTVTGLVGGCAAVGAGAGAGMAGSHTGTAKKTTPQASAQQAKPTPLVGKSATLTVHGLACPSCAAGVDKMLRQTKGVKAIEMDVVTGVVRLTLDPDAPPTRQDVENAVKWGGAVLVGLSQP